MLLDTIILAIIQAVTEFIPVSSSGHLLAAQEVFGLESSLALDVILHFGTLLALVIYFWPKLMELGRLAVQQHDFRLLIRLGISTVPAVVIGFLFEDAITDDARAIGVVIFMLAFVGAVMIWADRSLKGKHNLSHISQGSALLIGFGQALALIPGTSRSGATMLAGRLTGLGNAAAAEYAFLMGIPIIAGATLRVVLKPEVQDYITANALNTFGGVAVSAAGGYLAIRFMLDILRRHGLSAFGYYRIGLAFVLLIVVMTR